MEARSEELVAEASKSIVALYHDGGLGINAIPDMPTELTLPEASEMCVQWHEAIPGTDECIMGAACVGMRPTTPATSLETPPTPPFVLRAAKVGDVVFERCLPCILECVEMQALAIARCGVPPPMPLNKFAVKADDDSATAFPLSVCYQAVGTGGWTGIAGSFPRFSLLLFHRDVRKVVVRAEAGRVVKVDLNCFRIQPRLDF